MTDSAKVVNESPARKAGRRDFLVRVGSAGLGVAAGTFIAGCGGGSNSGPASAQSSTLDQQILNAAATAEALASTMYFNIISSPIYTTSLNGNAPDQAYLVAAYEQEISHYNTLVGAGAAPLATTFYFPTGMFTTGSGLQTTVDTLSVLEDAFIAAYLFGILSFSSVNNKVLAGQIMGVEAEHRALARVIAHDVGLSATGMFGGGTSSVVAPGAAANDLAYEHTYGVTSLSTITTALGPFLASGSPNYSTTPYNLSSSTIVSNGQIAPLYPSGVTPVTLSSSAPLQ